MNISKFFFFDISYFFKKKKTFVLVENFKNSFFLFLFSSPSLLFYFVHKQTIF